MNAFSEALNSRNIKTVHLFYRVTETCFVVIVCNQLVSLKCLYIYIYIYQYIYIYIYISIYIYNVYIYIIYII